MKNVTYKVFICLFMAVLILGCLETEEVKPATVKQATLNELGWAQMDRTQKETLDYKIGGIDIEINTAMVTYYDKSLTEDFNKGLNDFLRRYGSPKVDMGLNQYSSQFMTFRLALPSGITIPESVLMGIIDSQIQNMATQNNIRNFREVGEETVTISTGSTVSAKSYEGYIETEGSVAVGIRGVVATYSDEGTMTVLIGIIPLEDLRLKVPTSVKSSGYFTIDIDEEAEYQDILTLMENVE